jgi:Rieske Fe-S protein
MNDRRTFLKVLGAGALVSAGCGGEDEEGQSEASGPVPAGNVSDIPVGTVRVAGGKAVVIGRDQAGLYAMSTICTHQRCNMAKSGSISSGGLSCDCHGSEFDSNGEVVKGPARSTLKHWQVELAEDGTITIQAGTLVPADERVAVPVA